MIFEISKQDELLMRSYMKPNLYIITKEGIRKIKSIYHEYVNTIDNKVSEKLSLKITYKKVAS